jgi:hypothetical protein
MFDLMRGAASLEIKSSMDGPVEAGESAGALRPWRLVVLAVLCGTSNPRRLSGA